MHHQSDERTIASRGRNVAYVVRADGAVLVDLNDPHPVPLALNDSATAVWESIDGSSSSDEIVRLVAERYDVADEVIRDDVLAVLKRFADAGYLEFDGDGSVG